MATSPSFSFTAPLCSLTCSLTWVAACCSRREAGISDEASQPTPNAIRPAASGLPWDFCRITRGALCAASLTVVAAECAASLTLEAADEARSPTEWAAWPVPWPRSDAVPMTLSLTFCRAERARCLRSSTMRLGLTLYASASTSELRLLRVASISRRI